MLVLEKVTKNFEGVTAVLNLDLRIEKGKIYKMFASMPFSHRRYLGNNLDEDSSGEEVRLSLRVLWSFTRIRKVPTDHTRLIQR